MIHLINSTDRGGTELMLFKFCQATESIRHIVVCLGPAGVLDHDLRNLGNVDLMYINIFKTLNFPQLVGTMVWLRYNEKENELISWSYLGHLLCALMLTHLWFSRVVWNIRSDVQQYLSSKVFTKRITLRALRSYSKKVDKILYNSQRSFSDHTCFGFSSDNAAVVRNPIIFDYFDVDQVRRRYDRISSEGVAVGFIGRNAPVKNVRKALEVFLAFKRKYPLSRFFLIGRGYSAKWLAKMYPDLLDNNSLQAREQVIDVAPIFHKLDLFLNTSFSEGFPTVLVEAAAHYVPIVTSDVSDVALFLEDWQVCDGHNVDNYIEAIERIKNSTWDEYLDLVNKQYQMAKTMCDFPVQMNFFINEILNCPPSCTD